MKAITAVIYVLYSSEMHCHLQNINCLRLQPRSNAGSLLALSYH